MNTRFRSALLGSAMTAIAGTAAIVGLAAPASAACTFTTTVNPGDTYTCADTTTTDTTGLTGTDRNVPYSTSTIPLYVDIAAGVTVDGFGLALTDGDTGTGSLTVTNNGTIQVDAGAATAGGDDAALFLSSVNTPLIYGGTGSIINLGTGEGLGVAISGTGSLTANIGGSVQANNGDAVQVVSTSATGGAIGITTTAGQTLRASAGDGIDVTTAGSGNVGIINNADISSGDLGVNTLQDGIAVTSSGTGNVTLTNNGAIGTATDRAQLAGITADITNAASAGTLSVAGTGDIFSVGNAIDLSTAGSGTASVIYGGDLDTTAGNGIEVDTLAGAITVTSGGTITAINGNGIDTSSTTGNQTITANGDIDAGGIGILADSTDGDLTIGGTAAITSAGNGIDASATGTGDVTVNRTGTALLTSNGGDGIQVDTTTGAVIITSGAVTAADNGIEATSTTGAQTITASGAISSAAETILASATTGNITVNVNGNLTTTGLGDGVSTSTDGTAIVNVSAGNTVISGGDVINFYGAGTGTLNNSGTIGNATSGAAVYSSSTEQVTVNNLAGGTINGNVDLSDLGDTITNSGTFNFRGVNNFYLGTDVVTNNSGGTLTFAAGTVLNGLETLTNAGTLTAASGLTFDAGATAVTNTGTFNLAGTLDLGLGTDSFTNSGAGIVNLTGNATLAGAETVTNSGRINLGTFTLTGPAIALTNSGFIDTSGSAGLAGFTSLANSGTLDLAAGTFTAPLGLFTNSGTILADEGATTITGQTSFANSGTIDLSDGAIGDVLTINSDFAGSGGSTLLLDVDDDAGDQLVITGAASGSTTIDANLIGTGILNADGVLLVDAATATDGAFVLGDVSGNTSPLLDYSLAQDGGEFLLVTSINETGFAPLPVALIAGDMWYKSAEAVWAQNKLPSDGTNRMGIWGQIYAGREKAGGNDRQTINGLDQDVDNRVTTDHLGFQAGYGFPLGGMGSVGVTAGVGRADIDGNASGYKTKGFNIGAYGTFGGPAGIYGSVLAKHDQFDVEIDNSVFNDAAPDGRSNGVDGEVGYRFGTVSGPVFAASAGLSHVRTKLDGFSLAGLDYDYDDITSTRGRVGVRATGSGPISPFIDVRGYHEFSGDGDVRLSDGVDSYRLRADGRGTWVRAEVGVGGPASGLAPMVSVWADFGDVKGFGGRGSFRF